MAINTLSDNLKSQNDQLVDISKGIGQINTSFDKWFVTQERSRLDDLEKERDAKAAAAAAAAKSAPKSPVKSASGGKSKSGSGGMNIFGGLGGLAGGLGLGSILTGGSGMLLKGGMFGLSQIFSESIANSITEMTGNAQMGASAANIAKFATLGGLLGGKKGALIGGIGGALATKENIDTLKSIGDNLGERAKDARKGLENLGLTLPTLEQTYVAISTSSNDVLRGVEALVSGDVNQMQSDAVNMTKPIGLAVAGAQEFSRRRGGGQPPAKPVTKLPTHVERLKLNTATISKLNDTQLGQLAEKGITRARDNTLRGKGGRIMKMDAVDEALKGVGASTSSQSRGLKLALEKYKNFSKFAKIPLVSQLLSVPSMGLILANDNLTMAQKTEELSAIFGGLSGATLGTITGAAIGSFFMPGAGTVAGGGIGGLLGTFSGEYLARELALMVSGQAAELPKFIKSMFEKDANSPNPQRIGRMKAARSRSAARQVPTTGSAIQDGTNVASALTNGGRNGGGSIIAPAVSSTSNSQTQNNLVSNGITPFDTQDPFISATRGLYGF